MIAVLKSRLVWWLAAGAVLIVGVAVTVVVLRADEPRQIGAGVTVEGADLRDNLTATPAGPVTLPLPAELAAVVSDVYDIGPSGPLPAAMRVHLPVNETLHQTDEYLVTVFSSADAGSTWEALPTVIAADGRTVTATASHLSWFIVVKTWIGTVVDGAVDRAKSVLGAARTVFDGLTSDAFKEADAPSCKETEKARAGGYSATVSGRDAVLWCFGFENGRRVVKLTNNRRYPIRVGHQNLDVVDDGPAYSPRLAQLSKATSGQKTIVFPAETATFSVDLSAQGTEATLTTEFDSVAQSLYSLETGIRTALLFLTNFGAGSGNAVGGAIVNSQPVADLLDEALGDADCLSDLTGDLNIGKIIGDCIDADRLTGWFGKTAAAFLLPLFAVAPLLAYFRSQINALADQFNSRDKVTITISRTDTAQPCPDAGKTCLDSQRADVDGDGAADTVALFVEDEGANVGAFGARVTYATGETNEAYFGFGSPNDPQNPHGAPLPPDPVKEKFSFHGFADVNGYPGAEIFAKAYVNGDWSVRALQVVNEVDHQLARLQSDDDGLFVRSVNSPYLSHMILDPAEPTDGGFRCGTSSDGKPTITVWQVYIYEDGADSRWSRISREFSPGGNLGSWSSTPTPDDLPERPLKSRAEVKAAAKAERAKDSCNGLPALPPR